MPIWVKPISQSDFASTRWLSEFAMKQLCFSTRFVVEDEIPPKPATLGTPLSWIFLFVPFLRTAHLLKFWT